MIAFLIWLRLLSPHFEVITNAGERLAREAIERLEEIHAAFSPAAAVLPVRVYLFRSVSELRPFRTADTTTGFFQGGPERDLIVIGWAGPETYRVVFHEYVHLVMNHSRARMPQWFEEGTAEFYSSLEVAGGRLRIGTPIATHIRTLRTREWLDAPTLFGVTKTSPYYSERDKVGIFYAQSWALAHMLNLAPEYREGMARYAEGASFEEAFGKTPDAALRDLGKYVSEGRFPFVDLAIQQAARPDPSAEPLDDRAARMALAGLLLEVGKTREAETAYRKLAKENPDNAEIETALGALALRQRNHEEARRRLRRAIELGSRQAATHFEYAMLLRESGDERAEVAAHLGRAIELNPNFAEAHFLLGLMFTHAKRDKEAIPHLERAAAILPRQSHFWHALSMAYHRAGNAAEAQRAAHRALENAATVNEAGMARAALRLTGQAAPPAAQASQPAVVTPQSWVAPKGDAKVAGVLRRIDCFGASARLFIQTPGRHVALMITNPGEVLLRSASAVTFQFTCGPQKPVQVEVEYLTRPDSLQGTAGEVTAIEFR